MTTKPTLYVLTGPTAVGKTEWALRWAERNNAEILSCDSLLFYRGIRDETSTLDSLSAAGELPFVTGAYGVASWHLVEGDTARARALFEQIVATGQWPAFGFIGAEVDLARLKAP